MAAPRRTRAALLAALLLLAAPGAARGFVLSEDPLEETATELGVLARTFAFVLSGPPLRPPYAPTDTDPTGMGLFDLRLSFAHRTSWLRIELHNQLAGRISSHAALSPLSLGRGVPPPRWIPLEAELAGEQTLAIRTTVDWVYAAATWGPLTVTLGRQPITFGRGKFWRPMDLVAAFSLTEVDTEYKPGADAARIDFTVTERSSLTVVATAGEWDGALSLRGSAMALRGKLAWGRGEAGVLAGYVRRDGVLGADAVVDTGGFDVYGELVLTLVSDDSLTPREPVTDAVVVKGLLGATFRPTSKLTVSPEVYYNGFGAWEGRDYYTVALSDRLAVGEIQNLGQLYLTSLAAWEAHPLLNLDLGLIVNLHDPSALIFLGLRYSAAESVELLAGAYLPAGRRPNLRRTTAVGLPEPRSEFGLYPLFTFLELKVAM